MIVGYDEVRATASNKSGSHNLVVGQHHNYESYGGFVAGQFNTISGPSSSVSGGLSRTTTNFYDWVDGALF